MLVRQYILTTIWFMLFSIPIQHDCSLFPSDDQVVLQHGEIVAAASEEVLAELGSATAGDPNSPLTVPLAQRLQAPVPTDQLLLKY